MHDIPVLSVHIAVFPLEDGWEYTLSAEWETTGGDIVEGAQTLDTDGEIDSLYGAVKEACQALLEGLPELEPGKEG